MTSAWPITLTLHLAFMKITLKMHSNQLLKKCQSSQLDGLLLWCHAGQLQKTKYMKLQKLPSFLP